jgi:hypothetical protein
MYNDDFNFSDSLIIVNSNKFLKAKREQINFEKGDIVMIPSQIYEQIIQYHNDYYNIQLINPLTHKITYAKIVELKTLFNAIIIPKWMMQEIGCMYKQIVNIKYIKLQKIKKIIFNIPKEIIDPKSILEFELKKHSTFYIGKKIEISIFEKKFYVTIHELYFNKNIKNNYPNCGIINNENIDFEVRYNV